MPRSPLLADSLVILVHEHMTEKCVLKREYPPQAKAIPSAVRPLYEREHIANRAFRFVNLHMRHFLSWLVT